MAVEVTDEEKQRIKEMIDKLVEKAKIASEEYMESTATALSTPSLPPAQRVGGAAPGHGACARGRAGENCLPARDGGAKSDGFRQLYRQKLAASGRLCPLRLHNVCRQGEKYLASGRLLCAIFPKKRGMICCLCVREKRLSFPDVHGF